MFVLCVAPLLTTPPPKVFNTRKMSPVFTPGAESDVPPVFVDRFGAKAWTSHTGGRVGGKGRVGQGGWGSTERVLFCAWGVRG